MTDLSMDTSSALSARNNNNTDLAEEEGWGTQVGQVLDKRTVLRDQHSSHNASTERAGGAISRSESSMSTSSSTLPFTPSLEPITEGHGNNKGSHGGLLTALSHMIHKSPRARALTKDESQFSTTNLTDEMMTVQRVIADRESRPRLIEAISNVPFTKTPWQHLIYFIGAMCDENDSPDATKSKALLATYIASDGEHDVSGILEQETVMRLWAKESLSDVEKVTLLRDAKRQCLNVLVQNNSVYLRAFLI